MNWREDRERNMKEETYKYARYQKKMIKVRNRKKDRWTKMKERDRDCKVSDMNILLDS